MESPLQPLDEWMKTKIASTKYNVRVSSITAEGFWIHLPKKDYYISRKRYPWFLDATDEEIQEVSFTPEVDEYHKDMLLWHSLGVDFDGVSIEKPELIYHNISVRCVRRPDLFEQKSYTDEQNNEKDT